MMIIIAVMLYEALIMYKHRRHQPQPQPQQPYQHQLQPWTHVSRAVRPRPPNGSADVSLEGVPPNPSRTRSARALPCEPFGLWLRLIVTSYDRVWRIEPG